MMNVTATLHNRASIVNASEFGYAASMDFNAAHLPGGSSSTLVEESSPTGTTLLLDNTPLSIQQLISKRAQMISAS